MHWTAIVFWLVGVVIAAAGVAYAIRVRNRAAERNEDYLREHPDTDPHAPKGVRRSRDKYDPPNRAP